MSKSPKKSFTQKVVAAIVVILLVGIIVVIVIPNFIRMKYETAANACVNNLRQIEGAKEQWALENNKHSNDIPTSAEIAVYLKDDKLPLCPAGGTYTIGNLDENPKCSIGISAWPNEHVLNYTNNWWINFKMAYGIILSLHKVPPLGN